MSAAAAYDLPDGVETPWYPRPETLPGILSEVAELAGVPVALSFGAGYGGQRKYIPTPDAIDRHHWLAQAIGVKPAKMLAMRHGMCTVAIPAAIRERKVIAVLRLYVAGWTVNKIVTEVRMSRSHVKRLTYGLERPELSPRTIPAEQGCPLCGRRHAAARRVAAAGDDRQLCLPLPGTA